MLHATRPRSLACTSEGSGAGADKACVHTGGCEKTTTGVWTAYQHLVAVHTKGDAAETETGELWAEACRLWQDDLASQSSVTQKRTRGKVDHSIAGPELAYPPLRSDKG